MKRKYTMHRNFLRKSYFILLIFLVFPNVIFSQGITSVGFEISDYDTLGGNWGYFLNVKFNGELKETIFLIETTDWIIRYAHKTVSDTQYIYLPYPTYWSKIHSITIGDSWVSWDGGPTMVSVIDTTTIITPAGVFFTYVCEQRLQSNPDSITSTFLSSDNVGWVKLTHAPTDTVVLTEYSLAGGSGFYPLAVGNYWRFESMVSSVDDDKSAIGTSLNKYFLRQNYPNPFNPSTKINYQLPNASFVTLRVYDVLGNEIETLVNEEKPMGTYEINWIAKNLPSGVYFYRLQAGNFVETKKMVLLR